MYRHVFQLLDKAGLEKVTVTDNGLRVTGYTYSMWEYYTIKAKREYDIVGKEFAPGMTVVDVGANQGFFTLYAASKGARVFAVEPSASNFAILSENVAQNNYSDRVVCINGAVSDSNGTANLYEGLSSSGKFLSTTASICDENRGGTQVRVKETPVVTLDKLFETYNIGTCDLLKMDCEGAEYRILASASEDTFRRIKNISLEYHDGVDALRSSLARGGFEILSTRGGDVGLMKANNKAVASLA